MTTSFDPAATTLVTSHRPYTHPPTDCASSTLLVPPVYLLCALIYKSDLIHLVANKARATNMNETTSDAVAATLLEEGVEGKGESFKKAVDQVEEQVS